MTTIPCVFTEEKLDTEGVKGHAFAMAMLFGLELGQTVFRLGNDVEPRIVAMFGWDAGFMIG